MWDLFGNHIVGFLMVWLLCVFRAVIDLSNLEREKTHTIEQPLEDGAGLIKLLVTISGTSGHETISDLSSYAFNPDKRNEIVREFVSITRALFYVYVFQHVCWYVHMVCLPTCLSIHQSICWSSSYSDV